jgi:hypothetical protein
MICVDDVNDYSVLLAIKVDWKIQDWYLFTCPKDVRKTGKSRHAKFLNNRLLHLTEGLDPPSLCCLCHLVSCKVLYEGTVLYLCQCPDCSKNLLNLVVPLLLTIELS